MPNPIAPLTRVTALDAQMPIPAAQSLRGRSLGAIVVMHANAAHHGAQTFDRIDFDAKVVG